MEVIALLPGESESWTVPDEKPSDYEVPTEMVPRSSVEHEGQYTLSLVLVCRPSEDFAPYGVSVCGVETMVETQVYGSCQSVHLTPEDEVSVRLSDGYECRPIFFAVSIIRSE
jgi:hypothetical protein